MLSERTKAKLKISAETTGNSSANADPTFLLNALMAKLHLTYDADLCRLLGVQRPTMSKIRHGRLPVRASLLMRMHVASGLKFDELYTLLQGRPVCASPDTESRENKPGQFKKMLPAVRLPVVGETTEEVNRLLDALKDLLCVTTDTGLSYKLGVAGPIISHIRCGHKRIGVSLLVRMCHTTGMSLNALRSLLNGTEPAS
ncbi:helix-turn-helix domain-containing protein [Collimonas arenae]|uniref:helix-turn-helix domain-containing protein n=1 Tax=Collimonas arenae TaxID=279058 RepID=UPI00068D30C2